MDVVSALADLLVVLPASLGLIALLVGSGAIGEAVAYAKALIVCLVVVFAMKFALATCGEEASLFGIESPSGHVASAATFYGSLALMFGTRRAPALRIASAVAVVAFIVLVAISRVALRVHSRADTLIGAATGLVAIGVFLFNRPKHAPTDAPLSVASTLGPLTAVFAIGLLLVATHWTAEPWIDALAESFGAAAGLCH